MTYAAIQDYINTYIRPNDKKEITGGQTNYLLHAMLDFTNDSIAAIPASANIGTSDLAITSVVRKLKLNGSTASYSYGVYDQTGTDVLTKTDGQGKFWVPKGTIEMGVASGSPTYSQIYMKSGAYSHYWGVYNNQMYFDSAYYLNFNSGGSEIMQVNGGGLTMLNTKNITFSSATGTQIGTDPSEKMAFYGKTPVVQQILPTGAGKTVDDVITFLQTWGACKQS